MSKRCCDESKGQMIQREFKIGLNEVNAYGGCRSFIKAV